MTMIPDTTKMGHAAHGVMWRRLITVSATHRCRHGEAVLHGLALGEHLPPVVRRRGGGGGGLLHEGGDDLHAVAGPLAGLLVAAVGLRHAGTCGLWISSTAFIAKI